MKKLTILFSILIASISAFAAATTVSQITLSSASQGDKVLQIVVDNPFSDAYDNGYDAVIGANQPGGLYIYSGSERYSFWATNALGNNLPMGFGAVGDLEYTLSFQYFSGESYTIYDVLEDATITVNASTPNYVFTIDGSLANTAINDRFIINYVPAPAYEAVVTTNAYGLATFSYASDLVAVESGVKLYKGDLEGYELVLSDVDYVKANQGVIVYGEANTTYHFNVGNGTSSFDGNELLPASAWDYAAQDGYSIYVLSGTMLYLYEGTDMKPNKAFLKVDQNPNSGNAPARIRMVFNQETRVENVEAEAVKAEKFMENGQIFIRRGEAVYNLQGQIVK